MRHCSNPMEFIKVVKEATKESHSIHRYHCTECNLVVDVQIQDIIITEGDNGK